AHVTICVITPRVSKGRLGAGHGVASQFADMEKRAEARGWDGHLPPERQRHLRDPQGSRSQGQAPARLWGGASAGRGPPGGCGVVLEVGSYVQGGDLRLEITRCGRVDGLLAWIELAVAPGDAGLNSLVEDTNWLPVYVPFTLDEPIDVNVGDVLSLQVAVANADDGIHPEYFFRGQLTRTGSGAEVTVSAESRYSGGAFRSTVVHRGLLRRAAKVSAL